MSRHSGSNFFSGLLSFILLIFVIGSVIVFGAKKLLFDYDGKYATNRITYTDEYGISLLVTYHTKYQRSDAKGFAIVHIPPESLLNDPSLLSRKNGSDVTDSEEVFNRYGSVLLPLSMKAAEIPGKGAYFIMEYSDTIPVSASKQSW